MAGLIPAQSLPADSTPILIFIARLQGSLEKALFFRKK
jgi:hypothetical protein